MGFRVWPSVILVLILIIQTDAQPAGEAFLPVRERMDGWKFPDWFNYHPKQHEYVYGGIGPLPRTQKTSQEPAATQGPITVQKPRPITIQKPRPIPTVQKPWSVTSQKSITNKPVWSSPKEGWVFPRWSNSHSLHEDDLDKPLGTPLKTQNTTQAPVTTQKPVKVPVPGTTPRPKPVTTTTRSKPVTTPSTTTRSKPVTTQRPKSITQMTRQTTIPNLRPITAQGPFVAQSKQILQGTNNQLVWRFPEMSEIPEPPKGAVILEALEPADSVAVNCGEAYVEVSVKQDFFGTGLLIQPEQLSLGGCPVTGGFPFAQILVFQSELHGCGSNLEITEDELVYTFDLTYTPEDLGVPIFRTTGTTVEVSCHYPREHLVSTDALLPSWVPFTATKAAEDILVFALRLMTDDWKFERANNDYYLGNMLHIEASVIQYNHVPLRVFIHSCVATTVPDVRVLPRYSFIENHGCLIDSKMTGSRSRFLPRTREDKLQLELEAFRFVETDDPTIYITCELVATAASAFSDHKACSYAADGWTSAEGHDEVCLCCDSDCEDMATTNPLDVSGGDQWEGTAVLEVKVNEAY